MKNMNLKYIALSALAGVALGFFGSVGWYRWVWVGGEWREQARRKSQQERLMQTAQQAASMPSPNTAVFGLHTAPEHNQTLAQSPKSIEFVTQRSVVYGRLQLVKEGTPSATVIRTDEPDRSADGKMTTLPFPAGQGAGVYTVAYQICEAVTPTVTFPTLATGGSVGPKVTVTPEALQGSCQDSEFSFTIQ